MVPAAEHAVHPGEHDVTLSVASNRGQRQSGHSAHEHGRLAQVLPGDPALHRVPDDDQSERHAPHGPSESHVHLQRQRRVTESVLFGLVSLKNRFTLIQYIDSR